MECRYRSGLVYLLDRAEPRLAEVDQHVRRRRRGRGGRDLKNVVGLDVAVHDLGDLYSYGPV